MMPSSFTKMQQQLKLKLYMTWWIWLWLVLVLLLVSDLSLSMTTTMNPTTSHRVTEYFKSDVSMPTTLLELPVIIHVCDSSIVNYNNKSQSQNISTTSTSTNSTENHASENANAFIAEAAAAKLHSNMSFSIFNVPKYYIREQLRDNNQSIKFRLESREISCTNGQFQLNLPISYKSALELRPIGADPDLYFYYNTLQLEEAQSVHFSPDGYLTVNSIHYHPNEYCLQHHSILTTETPNSITINVCHPNCSANRPCLSKCCDLDEYWNDDVGECVVITTATTILWSPEFYTPNAFDCLDNFSLEFIHYKSSSPNCSDGSSPITYYQSDQHFRLLGNGTVTARIPPADWKPLPNSGFCIDKSLRSDSEGKMSSVQIIRACPGKVNTMRVKDSIAPIYLVILYSAASILLLTAAIYLILWKSQNLHGWCIFCEVVSMFAMILFVSIAHSLARDPDNGDYGSVHCVVIGALAHFFFLSTFFWLTVINADLWWNFRKLSPVHKSTNPAHNYRRFFLYLFISEIGPAIIVVIGLLLDEEYGLKNGGLDCADIIVPNYGQTNCYLSKPSQGPYLFYPIGILLGCNSAFFSLTLISMLKYRKGTQEILRGKSTNQTQSFTVVAKLFIVMGVSWIFEIVAWMVNQKPKQKNADGSTAGYVPSYWIVYDFVSLVQALAIFIIFIGRRTVILQLGAKFPCFQKILDLFPGTNKFRRPSQPSSAPSSRRATNASTRTSHYTISTSPSTTDEFRLSRIQSKTSSVLGAPTIRT